MKEPSPIPLPDVTPPPGGPVKANLKQAVPIEFFACSWQSAQDEVRQQRNCDWWIYDWPGVDFYWLFGNYYWWIQPQPDHSPLALRYYYDLVIDLNNATSQAYSRCESRRYASQSQPEPGLRLTISSRLDRSGGRRGSATESSGIEARLSVPFAGGTPPPTPCPMLRRELFANPVDFNYVLHGPGGGNFRWELRDQPAATDPYFELYGRTLRFSGSTSGHRTLGILHLMIDKVVDLWVRFEPRPIPPAVADRVDTEQPLSYRISAGPGNLGTAAVIEVTHLESGQIGYLSAHGSGYTPEQMREIPWPAAWSGMSMDADGIIRHRNADISYWFGVPDPASIGLPTSGTYRVRCILLAYGYQTGDRFVSSDALGLSGDTRMSWKPIRFSHMPSLIGYTPGNTVGLIPPFEMDYTATPVLYPQPPDGTGIQFDAAFDLKNLTTFRFVIKVGNPFGFALGLIVRAADWQAWVRLEPGETKYLAGCLSITAISSFSLHPYHGWQGSWTGGSVFMVDGQLFVYFYMFLTAPNNPETTPADIPALRAVWLWYHDPAILGPQYVLRRGAIKRYAPDGRYDYEHVLSDSVAITRVSRSIGKPDHQPMIDPVAHFVTGYMTSTSGPWYASPWTGFNHHKIMIDCERRRWDGSQYIWEPANEVQILLTRDMVRQVAVILGIDEYVVLDGDDIRWFVPSQEYASFRFDAWIDRFHTPSGTLIDEAAIRSAYQSVIDDNAASWPEYRSMVIHPSVRFGCVLENGRLPFGDYLVGQDGYMAEVSDLDVDLAGTRFLYCIRPEYR